MATDYAQLTRNLLRFYDFANKVVLFVGAGGKQLLDSSCGAKKLIAIDQDVEALRELKASVAEKGIQDSVEVVGGKFEDVALSGDVVYFEFCLHEMADPLKALMHAKSLAPLSAGILPAVARASRPRSGGRGRPPDSRRGGGATTDIVVYDHSPQSEWIFYGAEEDKVEQTSQLMKRFGVRAHEQFHAEQRFADFAELAAKLGPQGATAMQRALRFAGATNIVIPMDYELNLL